MAQQQNDRMLEISRQLGKAIDESNLTLSEIARKVECTQSYISQIRSGTKIPSNSMIQRLSSVLGYEEKQDEWAKMADEVRYNRKYSSSPQVGSKGLDSQPFVQLEDLLDQISRLSHEEIVWPNRSARLRIVQKLAALQTRLLEGIG